VGRAAQAIAVKDVETPMIESQPDWQEFGRCSRRPNSCQSNDEIP
jgi:hypothetical protein